MTGVLLAWSLLLAVPALEAAYVERSASWAPNPATELGLWVTKDLSGSPFLVPPNAVVEIAVRNHDRVLAFGGGAHFGGVRAAGSSLDRRIELHQADGDGFTYVTMHVQANSASEIEFFSETDEITFKVLGYWDAGAAYEEEFASIALTGSGWQTQALSGVAAGEVAEVAMTNRSNETSDNANNAGRWAGARKTGSPLDRRVLLDNAATWVIFIKSGGGENAATLFVEADGLSEVELYADNNVDPDITFYVLGSFTTPPAPFVELAETDWPTSAGLGSPAATYPTWENKDLSTWIPPGSVAEILVGHSADADQPSMGVRSPGSLLDRVVRPHDAGLGSPAAACCEDDGQFARMHVLADGTGTIEWASDSGLDADDNFLLSGYWTEPDDNGLPHEYYVPIPDEQVRTWAVAIDEGAYGVSDEVHTVISVTATLNWTVLYYDHWEDGFEIDLANPVQPNTEIWGDQDCSNGFTPLLGSCTPGVDDALDAVMGGDVIALENDVPANPRNPSAKYWDGGDKIGSSNLLAVTRVGWPTMVGAFSGVVLAGAVEVFVNSDWDTAFESPVGDDIGTSEMFQYTALAIMAQSNDTFVEVDADADGVVDIAQWLQEGESLLAEAVKVGASVSATQRVQVDILTGDKTGGDTAKAYGARWFALVPTTQWSDAYYSPVGETNPSAPVSVLAYNPGTSEIDIDYEFMATSGSFRAPAGGTFEFNIPANSGGLFEGRLRAARDEFNAIAYNGSDGSLAWTVDWREQNPDDGPTAGVIQVVTDPECTAGNCLRLNTGDFGASVSRRQDLSDASSATLTYDYDNQLSGSEEIEVSVYDGSWNQLRLYDSGNAGSGSESFDLTPYLNASTEIFFFVLSTGGDNLWIDNVQIAGTGWGTPPPADPAPFYVLSTIDQDQLAHDWGFSLIPETSLATAAQAGWAPGSSDLSQNGSPVWVTAEANTTLYIDYDGDGTSDTSSALSRLESLRIFDPDNDQTGMRIYTIDGTRIAAAWGQDPGTAGTGAPYLDLGTTVMPFINPLLLKDAKLYIDQNSNGVIEAGDTLLYTITIKNIAASDFVDGVLLDTPDPNMTYVASTTTVDDSPVADDSLPATAYPLDEVGYDLPTPMHPGQTIVVTYQMQVNDPVPGGVIALVNSATATAGDGSTSASATASVPLANLRLSKTSDAVGQVTPGQIINYTVTVENISGGTQTKIKVTDFLPLGTTYVAESTVATSPSITMDNVPGGVNPDLQDGSLPKLVKAADGCDLAPGQVLTVTYQLQVDDPLDPRIRGIFNYARATSAEMSHWVSDSTFNLAPTVVVVSSFSAYPDAGGVVVEWETSSEVGTAGFYLYRWNEERGEHVLVNDDLLPAAIGAPQGAVYRLLDDGASTGRVLEYALVEVEAGGVERSYGPFGVVVDPRRERPEMSGRYLVEPRAASARRASRGEKSGDEAAARASTPGSSLAFNTDRTVGLSRSFKGADTWLELTTREAGLYRVGSDELAAAFRLPREVIGSRIAEGSLRLENRGRQIPWQAEPDASAVHFFGEAVDSQYSEDNVYWLHLGKGLSTRSSSVGLEMPSMAVESTFQEHLHLEQDLLPALVTAQDPESDYWFWKGIAAGDETQGKGTFSISAPGLAAQSGWAELGIEVQGISDTPSSTDHHLVVRLNGSQIGETFWDGAVAHQATFDFSSALLQEEENEVEVEGLLDGNAPYSLFFIDSFDLSYRRLYRADNDRLLFSPDRSATVTIDGFASPRARVWDVTDHESAAAVATKQTIDGRSVTLQAVAGRTYLAVGERAIGKPTLRPVAVAPRSDLRDRGNAADYLLIAPSWLAAAAEALAKHRRGDGLETRVVELEEVYRQFNHGLESPRALESFLTHAYSEWSRPPRYVVLVGAGSFDYKDHLGLGGNAVPPIMVATPWGLFVSDVQLGDVVEGDGPEIAVGRLPVLDQTELEAYVEKLIAYESGAASGQALLLADDPDAGGNYVAASEAVASRLAGWNVEEIYLSREGLETARERLFAALDQGVSLVNYVGHAGMTRLAHEGLLTEDDLPLLADLHSPPVIAALTCVVGRFEVPGFESLAESLVLEPEGGAVAVWAASGLSLTDDADILNQAFVGALAEGGADGIVLGDGLLAALRQHAAEGLHPFLWRTYNLIGDPALPLH